MSLLQRDELSIATIAPSFPRVNLLPPEIAEERRFRKVRRAAAAAVAAGAMAAAALYGASLHEVSTAQRQLAAARQTQSALQTTAAKYADVPVVYAKVAAAEAQRQRALGKDVRWSAYLNDLGLRIPSNVWLTTMTMTEDVDGTGVASTPGGGSASGAAAAPGTSTGTGTGAPLAAITFKGAAFKENDVASWLDALAEQPSYADPYLQSSNLTAQGDRKLLSFSSTVAVTAQALSHHYDEKAGN